MVQKLLEKEPTCQEVGVAFHVAGYFGHLPIVEELIGVIPLEAQRVALNITVEIGQFEVAKFLSENLSESCSIESYKKIYRHRSSRSHPTFYRNIR